MKALLTNLHRTKAILGCVLLVTSGAILIALGQQLDDSTSWLALVPWNELGGVLVGAGVLSVWLDSYLRTEQQALDELRLRQLFQEQAPAMRDAVLQAFAADTADLERVATPTLLDQIITNSLALRLDDPQFASEVYADIRDQAVGAAERWYDAHLAIELAPLPAGRGAPLRSTPDPTSQFFTVTVRWEYTTIPHHRQRRFVCLSDRHEYVEATQARDGTSAWYLNPTAGIDATSRQGFELLQFTVNGEERPIRRAVRKSGQVYTVNVADEHLRSGVPVTVAYTYQTTMSRAGHLLFFDIEQPTRDLSVEFDYTDGDIAAVSILDLVPSVRPTRIEHSPNSAPARTIRLDIDGWIFPRSGVAFVWTLKYEARPEDRLST